MMNGKEDTGLPLVSVGILNCNRREELRTTITAVLKSDYPNLEISVADNGSSDGSAEMVRNEFPGVTLYEFSRNMGVAARNTLMFEAKGKYIVLYDDDSVPAMASTIGEIVDFLERHADVAALCTNVINYYTGESETRGWEEYAMASGDEYYEGLFMHGSGMTYRSQCIQATHGFPEDFFWGWEENDLTLQLVSKDLKIVYKPDIVTYHRRSPLHRDEKWAFLMRTRNGIWLFWKYFPFLPAVWLTLRFILRQAVITIARPTRLLSFFRGSYAGLKGAPMQRRKRELLTKEAIDKTKRWQQQNLVLSHRVIHEFFKQRFLK